MIVGPLVISNACFCIFFSFSRFSHQKLSSTRFHHQKYSQDFSPHFSSWWMPHTLMIFWGAVLYFGSPSFQEKPLVILMYFYEEMTNSSDIFFLIHLKTDYSFYVHLKIV